MTELTVGLIGETSELVTSDNTAARWGSGLVQVYATPAMIALMENAAVAATANYLPAGQATVGTRVEINHLAATPVGLTVRARAELTHIDGRKLHFNVEACDNMDKIGEGTHERFIIDMSRFEERASKKKNSTERAGS
jgi:predicted thioesterase